MARYLYLGPRISSELLEYIQKNKLLPGYPNLPLLSRLVVERVIWEVEEGKIEEIGEPPVFLLSWSQHYIKKIAERIFEVLEEVREVIQETGYKILLIVGAGLSFETGMPLTRHLKYILKPMNFDVKDYEDMKKAFSIISSLESKDKEFKERFISYLKQGLKEGKIKFTEAHKIIIREFINGKILEILCLNWDNLLELLYKKITGKKISKINREGKQILKDDFLHCLWKFHGDVEDPEYKWIYPGANGRVFPEFVKYCQFLINQKKYVLCGLIVGYSEQDEQISNIIMMIEQNFELFRIGMDMRLFNKYKKYILAPAAWILPQIFASDR